MSKSSHSFSVDIAAQEGLIEAILLQHIHILQTSFIERDQDPDTAWVRRSVRAYHITYPYLTDKKISGALDRMEERELIRSKIDNRVAYDRTKSVQLAKKGWAYFRENGFDKKGNGKDEKENGFAQKGESLQGSYSSFVYSFVEGEENTPAPENQNLKAEKTESGLVAPGRDLMNSLDKLKDFLEAQKKVSQWNRAKTILEAEQKIIEWAALGGIKTVRQRHNLAMRRFKDEDFPALVAHYVSVYTSTNEGSRASLLRDPVAHFEAGLFKYLKNEIAFERNYAPKEGGQTRQNGQPHSALPRSLQNMVGK